MWNIRVIVALSTFVSLAQCTDNPFTDGKPVPKTIILDLDHTLWNAYLDSDYKISKGLKKTDKMPPLKAGEQPFTYASNGKVVSNAKVENEKHNWEYSTDISNIVTIVKTHKEKIKLAVASKSPEGKALYTAFLEAIPAPKGAGCKGSTLYSCFDKVIIQDGDKVASLKELATTTGAEPAQMILYDDDKRNAKAATEVGVYMSLIGTGGKDNQNLLTMEMVKKGIVEWRTKGAGESTSKDSEKPLKKLQKSKTWTG